MMSKTNPLHPGAASLLDLMLDTIRESQAFRAEGKSMQAVCAENGYTDYRVFPNGRDACLTRLTYTVALLADLEYCGYGDRWCYESYEKAKAALDAWDGEGEPTGWHRHPDTGRRRENGDPATEHVNL
jgi:hypothetical protein